MTRMVFCRKYQQELEGLDAAPLPGKQGEEIFDLVDMVIVTLGGEGSKILRRGEDPIMIPAAKISGLVDPTGAGDAFRSGFVAGLVNGFDLEVCGRMGSVTSAFVVEENGTQNHAYTREDFERLD